MAIAYYGTELSPNQTETVEGYLICKNVPIARTGAQEYCGHELGLPGDQDRMVLVNRYPEDVFDPAALASFEGKPLTRGHPPEGVGPENHSAYAMGHVQNVRRQGDFMIADLYVNDPGLRSDVENSVLREVSCGYTCNYEPDGEGYRQTHIRGNHVAVVPRGRAGHEVAIKDSAQAAGKGNKRMNAFRKAIMTFFASAAKDAAPEELPGLVDTAVLALDAEPAEQAQEAEPAKKEEPTGDVMVERAPKGDDLGSKLDRLLEMMESVMHKNDREEKELHDGDDLEELIEKLSGDPHEAATIPADELDAACSPGARDAALELLRRVRPAVAAIEDKAARAKVTDALISAVKGGSGIGQILKMQQDSARAHNKAKPDFDSLCAQRKAACDARNPHKKKEA